MSAPDPSSATIVATAAAPGNFAIAAPPSLTRSRELGAVSLPVPTTTNLGTSSPAGAITSRLEPLLPVNRSAAAARRRDSPMRDTMRRLAGPNFKFSPQNRIRTPCQLVNGAKPSLRAAAMGNPWSKPVIGCEAAGLRRLPAIYGPDRTACKAAFYSGRVFLRLRFSRDRYALPLPSGFASAPVSAASAILSSIRERLNPAKS